ncbi:MAG TPA: carboxypeptidase-like regulatory domain-containing protein, partial [Vicinamibacterales bacterium]
MRTSVALLAVATALLSLAARPTEAQVLYGSLVVEARDSGGGAVPGASVTITQQETGWTRSGVTTGAGTVTFAQVPPGTFSVRVTLQGFKESLTTGVAVTEGGAARVASTLEVGQLNEEVTVAAGAAVLQTDRADVRTELNATQLENLPVPIGRNYQSLFTLVPGITPPENMHSTAVNPARGLGFTANGTTRNANTIRIEGAIANNIWLPHVAAYVPALEAIESVSVTTSTFDADLGLSGGMSANVLIKSGTNQFRGSAFEYHYDQGLKAKPFFLPAGQPKPNALENQAGGTLGGPIRQNNLFFFGSYQGTFDRQTSQRFGTVPTAAMRAGNLSASPTPIYDPRTGNASGTGRSAFDQNIIPGYRLDPIVQKLIAQLPLPTFTDRLTDNYFASGRYTFTRHTVDGKVNWNASNKLRFAGRVGWLNHNFVNPPMFGDLGGLPVNTTAAKMGQGLGNTVT